MFDNCQVIAKSKQKTRSHSDFTDRTNQFIYIGDVMNCEGGVEETITWLSNRLQTISAEICGEVSALKWSSISSDGVFLSQNSPYYKG